MLDTWAWLLTMFVAKFIMSQESAALYKHHSLDGASENKVSCAGNATRYRVLFNMFWQFLLQPELYIVRSSKESQFFRLPAPWNTKLLLKLFSLTVSRPEWSSASKPKFLLGHLLHQLFCLPNYALQKRGLSQDNELSGLTFLWPCMCAIGLDNANLKHHVYCLISMTEYWYTTAKGRRFLKIQPTTICWIEHTSVRNQAKTQ